MAIETRLFWIDKLRAISVIGVILIHVSGVILYQYGKVSNFDWWIGNIFDSAARFTVPVFGMIMGATLLSKVESPSKFLKKRLQRLVPPLLFWVLIFFIFSLSLLYFHQQEISLNLLQATFYEEFNEGFNNRFWYAYMVIGIYLLIPLMKSIISRVNDSILLIFLVVWFLLLILKIPIISSIISQNRITYFLFFLGYPILGFYLQSKPSIKLVIPLLLILSGFLITLIGTGVFSTTGEFNESFYSYLSPNVVMLATGLFLLFKDYFSNPISTNGIIQLLSSYSYGIYLVHLLVLWFLAYFGISWRLWHPVAGILITTMLCVSISALIIFLLSKMPFGKYFSGIN